MVLNRLDDAQFRIRGRSHSPRTRILAHWQFGVYKKTAANRHGNQVARRTVLDRVSFGVIPVAWYDFSGRGVLRGGRRRP